MSSPKPYSPTTVQSAESNQKTIDLINTPGFTYTSTFFNGPPSDYATPGLSGGITTGDKSFDLYKTLKKIPDSKRALKSSDYTFSGDILYFLPDSLTGSFPAKTFYREEWSTVSSTRTSTVWPNVGVSMVYDYWKTWLSGDTAINLQCISYDQEGAFYFTDNRTIDSATRTAIANDPNYSLPWKGLTSFKELYEYYANTTASLTSASYSFDAFVHVAAIYINWAWKNSMSDALTSVFPNALFHNYDDYPRDINADFTPTNTISDDGTLSLFGDIAGNGMAPVCYGQLRQSDIEFSTGVRISTENPFTLKLGTSTQNFVFGLKLQNYIKTGAWASFLINYTLLREAVRNARNRNLNDVYLFPYLNDVRGDNAYHLKGLEYKVKGTVFEQTPSEVLHNSWYFNNIDTVIPGYTAYDGSTLGYAIKTKNLGLTGGPTAGFGGIWYKYNIDNIEYDSGITNIFKITTVANTGATCGLALYLYNIQSGVTYNFSYYIDLDRGFTGSLARFTKGWATTNTISLAPERPTSTTSFAGVTFKQISPFTGATNYNLISPIFYNPGDSGWTKVGWQFVGDSTNTIGLHTYYARNSTTVTGGYNIFIKDPQLEIAGSSILHINPIDNEYELETAYSSFNYYYDGLCAGLTYVFSYYIDLSRGFTQTSYKLPQAQQVIQHSHARGYLLNDGVIGPPNRIFGRSSSGGTFTNSIGITFYQIEPIVSSNCFNYGPIGYSAGNTSWTKVAFAFRLDEHLKEKLNNTTLNCSVYAAQNFYSVFGITSSVNGYTAYVSHPLLEIQGVSSNTTVINPRKFDDAYRYYQWREGPPCAHTDYIKGDNPKGGVYYTDRGGNSAYWYELVRHTCLLGSKRIAWYNPGMFMDWSVPGALEISEGDRDKYSTASAFVLRSGYTGYLDYYRDANLCLQDVHDHIGGFTSTTADYSQVNWLTSYIASGAPGPNGITWWWRITVKPGYTLYCNGETLSTAINKVGMWLGTTGPTLAGITISSSFWGYREEIGITPANKDINFLGMTSLSDLTSIGFTFIRGSTATYVNSSGKIVEAGPNIPRFDHDPVTLEPTGLFMEATTINYLNWSESFANTGGGQNNWIDSGLTRISGNTSPGLLNNAIRFVAESENATLLSSTMLTGIPGASYSSLSFWARGFTGNEILQYTFNGGTSWFSVNGLSTGWYRYSYGPTAGTPLIGFRLGNTGNAIEIWGAQLEPRIFSGVRIWIATDDPIASSYIPTGNTFGIRRLDQCILGGSGLSSWYGGTYGTICYEYDNWLGYSLINGTYGNRFSANQMLLQIATSSVTSLYVYNGAYPKDQFTIENVFRNYKTSVIALNAPQKFVTTYSPNGIKYALDTNIGGSPFSSTNGLPPTATNLVFVIPDNQVGAGLSGYSKDGHVRRFRWWDYVMTDDEMKRLSSANINPYWMNYYD